MLVLRSLGVATPLPERTCAALGMFDGLHLGHRKVIDAAVAEAAAGGLAPCVFTFSIGSEHPAAKTKSGRLITSDLQSALLEDMGVTHMLRPPFEEFRGMGPQQFVEEVLHGILRASYVFCGENYHFGKGAAGGVEELRRLCAGFGIQVRTLPLVDLDGGPVSSTRIRGLIAAGELPAANRLLGRRFGINFEIIHGRQLGRTLDSPTINQPFPDWFVRPRFGVYATVTTVDGVRHISVTNVGHKPTVGSEQLLAETYIHGFQGDLYGRKILVEFLEFIRAEQKFSSVEELRQHIRQDSDTAVAIGGRYTL